CKEDVSLAPVSLVLISSNILFNALANSVTMFGREYIAIGDGKYGYDIPRQYNDSTLERIGNTGPGQSPSAIDYNVVYSMNTLAAAQAFQLAAQNITSISQSGNLVTVVTAAQALFTNGSIYRNIVGEKVRIAGAPAGYNGDFIVNTVTPGSNTFTYLLPTTGLASGAAGTAQSMAAAFSTLQHIFTGNSSDYNFYTNLLIGASL